MVLMAAIENDHRRGAKVTLTSAQPNSMAPSSSRARLHDFSFPTLSWGTHRVLRCSKAGAASSPASPETPSPDKEKTKSHRPEVGGSLQRQRQRAAQRPWNLRTRRSATAAPSRQAGSDDAHEEAAEAAERVPAPTTEAKKRAAFSIALVLSKQEIAEDFATIRGTRPPRRPKKRPRTVQRQLDLLYPGLCLADLAPGSYKIEER